MRFVKKFEKFLTEGAGPAPAPAKPKTRPGTKPGEKTTPGRRQRPSPIRRDRPAVEPAPKAKLPTASEDDVVKRFVNLMEEQGEDIKKYVKK